MKYVPSLDVTTVVVAAAFCLMILTFLNDWFVQRRNQMVVGAAARANAILSTLFPKNVRDRLFAERELEEKRNRTICLSLTYMVTRRTCQVTSLSKLVTSKQRIRMRMTTTWLSQSHRQTYSQRQQFCLRTSQALQRGFDS
jgi:hypothetical protein